jgi:hypothetical protein
MDALTKWSASALEKAKPRRLSFKRFAWLSVACILDVAASGYGYYWWAVDPPSTDVR